MPNKLLPLYRALRVAPFRKGRALTPSQLHTFFAMLLALAASVTVFSADEAPATSPGSFGMAKDKSGLTPDQLREKQLKQMLDEQEKQLKKAKSKKKGDKDDSGTMVIDHGSLQMVPSSRDKKEAAKENEKLAGSIMFERNSKTPRLIELKGVGAPKTNSGSSATLQLNDKKDGKENAPVLEQGSSAVLAPEAEKPGFFKRLFGKKEKKPEQGLHDAGSDPNMNLVDSAVKSTRVGSADEFLPSPGEKHDTLSDRVQRQMARIRIQNELEDEKKRPKKAEVVDSSIPANERKAETVDLDKGIRHVGGEAVLAPSSVPTTPSAPLPISPSGTAPIAAPAPLPGTGPAASQVAEIVPLSGDGVDPSAIIAKTQIEPGTAADVVDDSIPASEEELKAAADKQYRIGLTSNDNVLRQDAFERAARERRTDAIPYLLAEITKNKVLGTEAASCLGYIGKLTPDVEIVLLSNADDRDPIRRQTCIEALGRLRSKQAVPLLIERLRTEKTYQGRSACADALGLIGDKTAIPALKAKLEQSDEIEFVKARAALSLARLGDPSGRAHLISMFDSSRPDMQVIGLTGMAQLNDVEAPGYFSAALESRYDEVWTTAVFLFPRLGPDLALPILRTRLESPSETLRSRAALAMGFLGAPEAVPYIDRAVQTGTLHERAIGCELLGGMGRADKIPLLIEKLQDPHTDVRQTAAIALARLNATEAIPSLIEAARTQHNSDELPPGLRSAGPNIYERVVMLSCVRILRGEKDDLVLNSLPTGHDQRWPEFDSALTQQQVQLIKLFQLVDVVAADNQPVGAVLKLPDGKEVLFRKGEPVAGGFKVTDISLAMGKDKIKLPPSVTLMRGEERVILIEGRPPEVDLKEAKNADKKK